MSLLPIFMRLEGRRCLVVGAGTVAQTKIESLRAAGASITVVAPQAIAPIRELAAEGAVTWRERAFEPADLDGAFLVIAATNAPGINHAVYQESLRRNVLCNAVDDPPNCDFYFGSVVARGDLQIAISTAGESPALAQRLRREIDAQLPDDLGPWLSELGALRREVRAGTPPGEARNQLLHELAQRHLCSSPTCPTREFARDRVRAIQEEAAAETEIPA
jgi:siroheme synthase-like protein